MNSSDLSIIIRAIDEASAPMRQVATAVEGLGGVVTGATQRMSGFVDTLGRVGLAILGLKQVAETVGNIAVGMVSGNAEMERYETQLGTLMGSAGLAKQRLAELAKFGAETPFELPEVVRAEKVLLGFGLTGQRVLSMTGQSAAQFRTTVGDVAAGTGASFEEIALTFGKFSSGATGEAISRLQELGIVTREQMAAVGIQFSKSGELVSPLPQAMAAAVQIANEKFGGGMQKLSQTFEGRMSTFQDNWNSAKRTLTEPIFDRLSIALDRINTQMSTPAFQAGLQRMAELIDTGLTKAIRGANIAFQAAVELWPRIHAAIQPAITAVEGFVSAISRGESVTKAATTNLGPLFDALRDRVTAALLALADNVGTALMRAGAELVGWIVPHLPMLLQNLGSAESIIRTWALQMLPSLIGWLSPWSGAIAGWVIPAIPILVAHLAEWLNALTAWISSTSPTAATSFSAWTSAAVNWVTNAIPQLLGALGGLLTSISAWIASNATQIATAVASWAAMLVGWVIATVPKILEQLGAALVRIGDWIVSNASKLEQSIRTWAGILADWVTTVAWPRLLANLTTLGTNAVTWIVSNGPRIAAAIGEWGERVANKATDIVQWFIDKLPPIIDQFLSWVEGASGGSMGLPMAIGRLGMKLLELLGAIAVVVGRHMLTVWIPAFISWIPTMIGYLVSALFNGISEALFSLFSDQKLPAGKQSGVNLGNLILGGLVAAIYLWPGAAISAVGAIAGPLFAGIGGALIPAIGGLFSAAGPVVAAIGAALTAPITLGIAAVAVVLLAWINDWFGIRTKVGEVASNAFEIGRSIIVGIGQGISDTMDWLARHIRNSMMILPKVVRDALGIASPSKVFALQVGLPIVQGIAAGITAGASGVHGALLAATTPGSLSLPAMGAMGFAGSGGATGGSVTTMSPSWNVRVMVGDREIRDLLVDVGERNAQAGRAY